jgi:RHS repeat-associated protein
VTDENDNIVQTLDYYPYGATRVSVSTSTNEKRKYIDQFADDSGLNYLNARYYNPTQGQFLTQDPTFLAVGNPNQIQQLSQQNQKMVLADPQQLNSYSYGRDNPITQKDPGGNAASQFAEIIYNIMYLNGGRSSLSSVNDYISGVSQTHQTNRAMNLNSSSIQARLQHRPPRFSI